MQDVSNRPSGGAGAILVSSKALLPSSIGFKSPTNQRPAFFNFSFDQSGESHDVKECFLELLSKLFKYVL